MNKTEWRRFLRGFRFAFRGIIDSLRSEINLRFHFGAMAAVLFFGVLLHISGTEWMICVLCFALVIGSELINTAIEHAVNLAAKGELSEQARLAKDAAAGAVLFCAIAAAAVGLMIFLPKILALL